MRVTNALIQKTLLQRVTSAQSRLLRVEEQATSGRRVVQPEDDPAAAALARRLDASLAELESFEPASREVRSNLGAADNVLGSVFDRLVRVKEVALHGLNGAVNDENRDVMGEEIEQIRQELVDLANTKVGDDYLFGGYRPDVPPFLADGTYQGSPSVPEVDIAPGVRVAMGPNSGQVFTAAGGVDVMDVVADIRDALYAGDLTALSNELGNLDTAQSQAKLERANLGHLMNRVEGADEQRAALSLELTRKRSDAIDADIAETISNMTLTTQALEAALTVTARALSHSLLDKLG
jgi:flagellar hook-associated protein 3 FlgL